MRKLMCTLLVLLCAVFTLSFALAEGPALQLDYGTAVTRTYTVEAPEADNAEPIEAQEIVLFKGKSHKLTSQLSGVEDSKQAKIAWSTSDKNIVAINKGTITGKKAGTAVITCTATLKDGTVLEASVQVAVEVKLTKLSAKAASLKVNAGYSTEPVAIKFTPADATCQDLIWASADEAIATVDASGRITGVGIGKTKITATSAQQGDKPVTLTLNVTVQQPVAAITLDQSELNLAKGKAVKLVAAVTPDNAANKKLTWTSSDTKVATVSNGTVTGKGVGTATITVAATDGSGMTDTAVVTVYQPVTGVSAKNTKVSVTKGKTVTLAVTVKPSDAADKTIKWSSSNNAIATVDENGRVTGVSAGQCKITAASSENPQKKATFTVTVEPIIPLDALKFTRSGYFGAYYEFAITFKNLTKSRTVTYIGFDVKYDYNGKTNTATGFYTDNDRLGPGATRKIGWWDQFGYRLSYYTNFRVYLTSVRYSDGTWDYFSKDNLIGWFN